MTGIILAGGKGTRMGNLTQEMPKSMLRIGGQPLLEHQIFLLKKYNITNIIILVNFFKEQIIDYFGDGSQLGVQISYFEEPEPLGTVGGIKEIENSIKDDFIVFYGDVMINMDINRLIGYHKKKSSECTLVLHPNDHPFDSDLVETDNEGRVIRMYPKPHDPKQYYPNLVNAGVYLFSRAIFPYLEKGKKADFGRDVFPMIYETIQMFGYNTSEYLKDMGTPERLQEVEKDYTSGKIQRSGYNMKQKAVFLDRDGVINEEISFIHEPNALQLYPFTSEAVRRLNESEYKAIVVTNQSVIARNLCTFEELKLVHNKMETELGKSRAKLDAIYFCPHHPDKGYPEERKEYKIECLCRKPKPGMLFEAAVDFNLDLNQSFIIGDSERDILAGIHAGCTTVGVMTGYGLKKTSVIPDFLFGDLKEAVDFIVDEPYKYVFDTVISQLLKKPSVLLIGGNARSGKSTLAAYLKWKMERNGLKTLKIGLDNWILPENKRESCKNVYDRFRLEKIEQDIQQILAGIKVTVGPYNMYPEGKVSAVSYRYTGEEVILIEGVVALSSAIIRELAHYKIFMDTDNSIHRQRIGEFYSWRGKTQGETEQLYMQRLQNEYQLIEKERKFADLIVNSVS